MAADGGQVFLLPQGLGVDGAALGGDGNKIVGQFPQALFLAPAGQADAVAHGLFFQRGVIFHQGNHAVHRVSGGVNVRFGTGEPQHRATAHSGYVKLLFQKMDVLIAIAENRGGQLDAVQFNRTFCQMVILPVYYISTFRLYHSFSTKETVNVAQNFPTPFDVPTRSREKVVYFTAFRRYLRKKCRSQCRPRHPLLGRYCGVLLR